MNISEFNQFVRDIYHTTDFIPLHEPRFIGNEKRYVNDTIESTFVSSVGSYVNQFECAITQYTGSRYAIATMNGTAALHMALLLAGVKSNDVVITQALTFVATCNALSYIGAEPVFVDVSMKTLGMCPEALASYLEEYAYTGDDGYSYSKSSNKKISAIVPMHTFGHPVELDELLEVAKKWNIVVIEDAAESLGSLYKNQHTGTQSHLAAISFNGNKVITTGGGGMILCQNEDLAKKAKHLTTTAKLPHPYEFYHDENGYNYRLPNLNAALGVAQMENLNMFIEHKRSLAEQYKTFFLTQKDVKFIEEPANCRSNYWLNAIICQDKTHRDEVLTQTNQLQVMTRPIWTLMTKLPMYKNTQVMDLSNSVWLEERVINIPSSVPLSVLK